MYTSLIAIDWKDFGEWKTTVYISRSETHELLNLHSVKTGAVSDLWLNNLRPRGINLLRCGHSFGLDSESEVSQEGNITVYCHIVGFCHPPTRSATSQNTASRRKKKREKTSEHQHTHDLQWLLSADFTPLHWTCHFNNSKHTLWCGFRHMQLKCQDCTSDYVCDDICGRPCRFHLGNEQ